MHNLRKSSLMLIVKMMILPKLPMNIFVSLVGLIRENTLLECAYISRMKKRQGPKLNKDFDTKWQKELAEERTKDEEFFVNYNPLANSAFGFWSSRKTKWDS